MSLSSPQKMARDTSQVQVINRAIAIMRTLKDSGGLNLSQLARKVGMARSTVHRIITTLENEGLVTTAASDGRIHLGFELLSLGAGVHSDLRHELHPYLETLSVSLDETVDLSIRDKDHIIFLDQIARLRRLRAVSGVGMKFPLHCTATGKALLSTLSDDEIEQIIPPQLEVFTPNTVRTRDQLMREIETVRLEGVAFDREEYTVGICAVGAALKGPQHTTVAISIPVPSVRFYGSEERFSRALLETCLTIKTRYQI